MMTTKPTPSTNGLPVVHFADARTGWAVGEGGTIMATRDGGASWELQRSGSRLLRQRVRIIQMRGENYFFAFLRPLLRPLAAMAKSSIFLPDLIAAASQRGFRPRPAHVSAGFSGLRYLAATGPRAPRPTIPFAELGEFRLKGAALLRDLNNEHCLDVSFQFHKLFYGHCFQRHRSSPFVVDD
jgi:hypothetical protein